ncbi:MAG: hypothetical protein R3D66_03785 [Alphaproteobacteria bacterium]
MSPQFRLLSGLCALPAHKVRGREFESLRLPPFLPQIFPGYDVYFWMDADTWVQS